MKLYTIGYGGRAPQDLLAVLAARGVRAVVDVRLRPDRASMGAYTRAKTPDKGIQRLLSTAGIDYVPRPELGNVFLDCEDWLPRYRALLDRAGDLLTSRLDGVPTPFCLLCAERDVRECHRLAIGNFMAGRDWEVEHIG